MTFKKVVKLQFIAFQIGEQHANPEGSVSYAAASHQGVPSIHAR